MNRFRGSEGLHPSLGDVTLCLRRSKDSGLLGSCLGLKGCDLSAKGEALRGLRFRSMANSLGCIGGIYRQELPSQERVFPCLENPFPLLNFILGNHSPDSNRPTMKLRRIYRSFWILTVWTMSCLPFGCGETDTGASTTAPEWQWGSDTAFVDFLDLFPTDKDFKDWPRSGQWPIIKDPEFYSGKPVEPLLFTAYQKIPSRFLKRIPTHQILNLDGYSTKIKKPYKDFKFYAFHKVKQKNYWLVGVYAQKQQRKTNNEFFGHPFLLITYSKSGKLIDSFVWWYIDEDTLQAWTEIAVEGETLLVGRKEKLHDIYLTEIYQKTILTKGGRFQTVFSGFPECGY